MQHVGALIKPLNRGATFLSALQCHVAYCFLKLRSVMIPAEPAQRVFSLRICEACAMEKWEVYTRVYTSHPITSHRRCTFCKR